MTPPPPPSWRKPAGALALVAIPLLWAATVANAAPWIGTLPALIQAAVYLTAGIVWIFPMRPLLRWMETGAWRE